MGGDFRSNWRAKPIPLFACLHVADAPSRSLSSSTGCGMHGLLPCLPHSYVAPAQMGCDSWQVLVGTRMQEGI